MMIRKSKSVVTILWVVFKLENLRKIGRFSMMMRIKGLLMKKKVVEELYDDFMYCIKYKKT